MELTQGLPPNIIEAKNVCLKHAEDLIRAATRVLTDENLPHISYHLSTLALEEIGKSNLLGVVYLSKQRKDARWNPEKLLDDHVKKLFWAAFGTYFGRKKLTRELLEETLVWAKDVHEIRLRGLYVELKESGLNLPQKAVTESMAEGILNGAKALLEAEKIQDFDEQMSDERSALMIWFLTATDDVEKMKLIMGSKSMEELAELGSVHAWVMWLKAQFDESDALAQADTKRELNRVATIEDIGIDKWKMRIRLFSSSHSIRPKVLNKWNQMGTWIKIFPVDNKKNQMILELTLRKSVTVHNLYQIGWGIARSFVTALNIGSFGIFWWYVPEHTSRYYEKLIDIETGSQLRLERNPILKFDWENRALNDADLINASLCFGMMPRDNESILGLSLGSYIGGISFLTKNDIHLRLEANAYHYFYEALKMAMRSFRDWDGTIPFSEAFRKFFGSWFGWPDEEFTTYLKFFESFDNIPARAAEMNLEDVGKIKVLCDAYYLKNFKDKSKARQEKETVNEPM